MRGHGGAMKVVHSCSRHATATGSALLLSLTPTSSRSEGRAHLHSSPLFKQSRSSPLKRATSVLLMPLWARSQQLIRRVTTVQSESAVQARLIAR